MKHGSTILRSLVLFVLAIRAVGERPNILLIVSEDNGPEIGCYGAPVTTPHFDRLAGEGTLFWNAYAPQAGCSQSRASFLTGLYPHQHGQIGLATWKYAMYSDHVPNVVNVLQGAGYRTGIIGKLHVNPESAFPFDFKALPASNFARRQMHAYVEHAADFFAQDDEPFYLQVNFPDAHRPFIRSVDGLPSSPLGAEDVEALPYMGIQHPELRQQTADYYNCMMRLDAHVGELLKALEASGKKEGTLVVYIGDHGADLLRGKRSSYEGGVKIPMIIRWPGAKVGQERTELVSTLDLFPTFCSAAGVPAPPSLPGRSLGSILQGQHPPWRRYLFTEFHVHSNHNPWPQRSVRDARYKLIHNPLAGEVNPGYAFTTGKAFLKTPEAELLATASAQVRSAYRLSRTPPAYELYDLQQDPFEFMNLAPDPAYAGVHARLQAALRDWQRQTQDALLDPENARKLFTMIREAGTKKRKALPYASFMQSP
ncbi:MAG: sulfatase [Verrucomicrobiota bacterium]|nr:sulfatase [Verrucomicrobiota bacterium]